MKYRVLSVGGVLGAAVWLLAVTVNLLALPALAQSTDAKPTEQQPAAGQGAAEGRRVCRGAADFGRSGRQSRMRLARPSGGQPAMARRSRHRLPPSRSLRPVRLPQRPYPGELPLSAVARRQHRSEGRRQLERAGAGLLAQSVLAGRSGARRGRAKPDHQPLAQRRGRVRRSYVKKIGGIAPCRLEFATPAVYFLICRSQGSFTLLTTLVEPWG